MSSIFGLADLPVETIGDVIQPNSNSKVPEPVVRPLSTPQLPESTKQAFKRRALLADKYSSVRNRGGFGKFMKNFIKLK